MKRVAVIGGGSAGLCVARHFLREAKYKVRVFEKSNVVGGTWAYDQKAEFERIEDAANIKAVSTMYKNLRTNLPKQVMVFPDFPYPKEYPTFLTHSQVQDYLQMYAHKFNLNRHVELNTEVTRVDPVEGKDAQPGFIQWNVTTRNLKSNESETETCDAVVVCNGHFSVPKLPDIKNLSKFKGFTCHSQTYKTPNPFKGMSVVCLGAGASGRDIAVDLSSYASDVVLSHKNIPLPTELPSKVVEKPFIKEIADNGEVVFMDGSHYPADAIVFCTGYHYEFPFLTKNCRVAIRKVTITPLYKHLFHILFPSMSFVGLGREICPFPLFHYQAQCILKVLSGERQLPAIEEMFSETFREIYERAISDGREDRYHNFGPRQWSYYDSLADLAGIQRLPPYLQKLFNHVLYARNHDLLNYRKQNYSIKNAEDFVQI